MKFIFFIGESTTLSQIQKVKKQLKISKSAQIVLLCTLVTVSRAERLANQLDAQIYLLSATSFEITRALSQTLDHPENIIVISGGSWLNALAIASALKKTKLNVLRGQNLTKVQLEGL